MPLSWSISLQQPPEVVAIAKNIHGYVPSEKFLLKELWSLHLYRYSGELVIQGESLTIAPGFASVVPPGVENEYRYRGMSAHLYVHFRLGSLEPNSQILAMQDLETRFAGIYNRLAETIGRSSTQVNARVWDTLWDLATSELHPDHPNSIHPSVELVTRLIEERLSSPISVSQLAREAEVTPSYLSQLFRQVHGEPVLGYVRKRRMQQAIHLLQNSTQPIKSIATSVGYPDLQHFNKVVRQETGKSPRNLRTSS